MDWWVDGEIMQVRQLQAFNPTLFSRKLCDGCALLAGLCSEVVVFLYTFVEKSEQGTGCTSKC